MQLVAPERPSPVRARLRAAACMLLASAIPAGAHADSGTTTQLDASALVYGEQNRADVVEPTVRVTRLHPDGQSFSMGLTLDAITGASPSGAMPAGRVQTTTSASGAVTTHSPGEIPTSKFQDFRGAVDFGWQQPIGALANATTATHYSREKDYQSVGGSAKLSLDLMHRLTTVTVGAGYDYDDVFPVGGTRLGLSDGTTLVGTNADVKRVTSGLVGVSRVLTRRWMVSLNGSRIVQRGYLTEPYKIVSLVDPDSGTTVGQLTEQRPTARTRNDVLASSVYHLTSDVLYASYRYYWDDWGVRSHAIDLKYRRELPDQAYLQPHLRFYTQSQAEFFRFGLIRGDPVPEFATSDYRLGPLRSATVGATYGFHVPNYPGEFSVRAEYMAQWGAGHPPGAVGIQRQLDLFPPVSIGTLMIGYSLAF